MCIVLESGLGLDLVYLVRVRSDVKVSLQNIDRTWLWVGLVLRVRFILCFGLGLVIVLALR